MCGFAGYLNLAHSASEHEETLHRMGASLRHRGPDDAGIWFHENSEVGLCHRRLSILDLSPEGHQPMISQSGRYVIAYNGEVYNYGEIRDELLRQESIGFRGNSDTEVILEAIARWGVAASVRKMIGMFAFALWDRETSTLHLARDRLGIKPLYLLRKGETIAFASELTALRALPGFTAAIDREALAALTRFGYIPAPRSIFEGIEKVQPGTHLTFVRDQNGRLSESTSTYWSAREVALRGQENPFSGSEADAIEALDAHLRQAVLRRMIADVPLGAFLSGGIDSSLVVSLMQAQHSSPIKTFSIGSESRDYDESPFAREVANHLGTDHHELVVSAEDALRVIPRLSTIYDEPFADASQIPTYLVSQLARKDVTVTLSGDGGDELFAGYDRHVWCERLWQVANILPRGMRKQLARRACSVTQTQWNALYHRVSRLLPRQLRMTEPGVKVHKLAGFLGAPSRDEFYASLISKCPPQFSLVQGIPSAWEDPGSGSDAFSSFTRYTMYADLVHYLPDDVLVKLDRASMNVGLESRVPILDHNVVEFAWTLPTEFMIANGEGKQVLRRVLDRYVPRDFFDRPKQGFFIPLADWLRGPLRPWAEDLLEESLLQQQGYLEPASVRSLWDRFQNGEALQTAVWSLLMFQTWMDSGSQAQLPAEGPRLAA